ncbi:MAG: N-acetyltransferase family protein [Candidatus Thorarchaeota archaeon]|jgi:N-acetylglutamate synthase-like GNAT family acetyltransferase
MILRTLRESDIPDILEIAKLTWDGHDYVPQTVNDWLRDPKCHSFVIEQNETVVSLANLREIENGRTGWLEGLRVHPDARRKGLGTRLTDHLVALAKELDMDRLRLATAEENEAPQRLANRIGMGMSSKFSVFWKAFQGSIQWRNTSTSMEPREPEEVYELVSEMPDIIPNGHLICHWDILDAKKEAIEKFGGIAEYWIGFRSEKMVSLSLGFIRAERFGPEWCATIYAQDVEAYLSSLSHHLGFAVEKQASSLMSIQQVEFKDSYRRLDWLAEINHEITLVLFEMSLR